MSRLYASLAGSLVLVALAVDLIFWIQNLARVAARVPELETALQAEIDKGTGLRVENKRVQDNAARYFRELESLRADARAPVSIRVCAQPASTTARAPDPAPEFRTDGATPGAGRVPESAAVPGARDIGPDLDLSARRADQLSAQVRGLQEYVAGLPKECLTATP